MLTKLQPGHHLDKLFQCADAAWQGDETVSLSLSSPTGGAVLGLDAATLTIADRPFDAWRVLVFGADANLPEAQAGADYDGDLLTNFLEYSLDTDPTSPGGSGVEVTMDPGDRLQISFTRNLAATDVIFSARAADDLPGTWQSIASKSGTAAWTFDPGVTVNDNPGTGEVTITDSVTTSTQPQRFLHLEVEQVAE